jgi:hypothetical protein
MLRSRDYLSGPEHGTPAVISNCYLESMYPEKSNDVGGMLNLRRYSVPMIAHLGEELAVLKSRIMRSTGIDDTLRAWSQGIVGHKAFQQMTEQFAEVVIPQVWLREGRKLSHVAERLSISPKKVRRILRSVGLPHTI